ncbi:MAG TPA: 2-C-methyl-D-erythritol 4-phosphate cytidylyltransferase [Candidatus Polarisedimenticolaceae bacterium]|nr:2-C-methyl-D-erythritol 4-phosphate cytidylyltransferase [Candidatus Polarisedimenticolaceae bacterium]
MSRAFGIVVAAGASTRFGGRVPKQFLPLDGETVVARSVRAIASCPGIDRVLVVLSPEVLDGPHAAALRDLAAVVPGGSTRMRSVLAGVEAADGADLVLVHDAARPFVPASVVRDVLEAAARHGAAIPALPAGDTVKREDAGGFVLETLDRKALRLAQTPQGARRDWLLEALRSAAAAGAEVTDEAQALERAGRRVAIVPGAAENVKITTPDDLPREPGWRVGHGFDVHRFAPGRPLVLGGVAFPGEAGLEGHSDADVVFHAAMDAVLGAAGLPDIGHHFPPGDPRFAGADSARLAREVAREIAAAGWRIVNVDLTVLAERPKIAVSAAAMKESIGAALGIAPAVVGLKATTLEGLGALGRGDGIACHAVALIGRAR